MEAQVSAEGTCITGASHQNPYNGSGTERVGLFVKDILQEHFQRILHDRFLHSRKHTNDCCVTIVIGPHSFACARSTYLKKHFQAGSLFRVDLQQIGHNVAHMHVVFGTARRLVLATHYLQAQSLD